jgi:hypothetical protein
MLKPVLLCVLLAMVGAAAALRATEEGSGGDGGGLSRQFSDTEDLEDETEDGLLPEDEDEGSGDDADWVPPVTTTAKGKGKEKKIAPAMSSSLPQAAAEEYEIHLDRDDEEAPSSSSLEKTTATSSKKTDDMYEYYDELYPDEYKDIMKNYAPDDGDNKEEEDYQYTDSSSDFDRDSVLKIDEKKTTEEEDKDTNDIEIKPRPGTSGTEEAILETSQIFIMVGSACVSFAIVMLTFFLCRRAMAKKRAKKSQLAAFAYNVPGGEGRKEANIVKDYQKVPTSTRELLQFQSTRIDMYGVGGGEKGAAAAASAPLVQ